MSLTPDNLTKRDFKERGYHITKAEHYVYIPNKSIKIKRDFLGIYDYIAFNDEETICIQTTTKHNSLARRKKMLGSQAFKWWTAPKAKRRSILQGWYMEKGRWKVQEEELTLNDWQLFQAELSKNDEELEKLSSEELTQRLFPT